MSDIILEVRDLKKYFEMSKPFFDTCEANRLTGW